MWQETACKVANIIITVRHYEQARSELTLAKVNKKALHKKKAVSEVGASKAAFSKEDMRLLTLASLLFAAAGLLWWWRKKTFMPLNLTYSFIYERE